MQRLRSLKLKLNFYEAVKVYLELWEAHELLQDAPPFSDTLSAT